MQNHHDPAEEHLYHQLAGLRAFARELAGQGDTVAGAGVYEAVSSLVAAAEAFVEGIVDERIVVALDILAEVLGADLDGAPAVSPGLRQVQAARYDLVLMDIQMPEMDGQSATEAIRALPGPVGRVPIVAMTANAMPEERAAYLAAGMNDHVSKPINPRLLAEAIERVAVAAEAPVSEHGELT